jgi:hypothetical protein
MAITLTATDAKLSLNAHVAAKGADLFQKYGPQIGWSQLQAILQDPACVRYPCTLEFDGARLNPGEFAFPEPKGERPEDGFTLFVHPVYMTQLPLVPHLALYQLVAVNYGDFASADDAETFAAHALGLPREEYYQILCGLADQLGTGTEAVTGHDHAPGECSCGGGCGGSG